MFTKRIIDYRGSYLFLLVLTIIVCACNAGVTPTTEIVVQPPLPTPTLEPTYTPSSSPTDTPAPSPTPTAEPTPTPILQASLSGRILDQATGQPVAGAKVSAGSERATTDTEGRYTFTSLPAGQYILSTTHDGYDPGLSAIFTVAAGQELEVDLTLYAPDTSPYPQDPMLTNPLDPNGAPTKTDAERLARLQGLTGEVVNIEETKLSGEYLVNYRIGDDIRAAVAEINHEVWELTDETGRKWWIIKVCGNLVSRLPEQATIAIPAPKPLPPMAEVLIDGLVVRGCASEDCSEIGVVSLGERVEVFGCLAGGDWCQVGWSGERGWCTGQSLRQLAVAEVVPVVKAILPTATPEVVVADQDRIVFTCVLYDYKVNTDGTFVTHPVDGSKIFDTKYEICVINPDGSGLTRLTYHNDRNYARDPAWSPDKRRIAFYDDGDIYTMNADGSGLIRLTNRTDIDISDPAWSPDGQRIAFCFRPKEGGKSGIYLINVTGSDLSQLTGAGCSLAWSPDGIRIAFQGIYVMNVDGSNLTHLTDGDLPDWSPNGQQLVFTSFHDDDQRGEIYLINIDGSSLTRLTNQPGLDGWPDWSPDGQKIVFDSERGGTGDSHLYIMNADGSGVTRLTDNIEMNGGVTLLVMGLYPDW